MIKFVQQYIETSDSVKISASTLGSTWNGYLLLSKKIVVYGADDSTVDKLPQEPTVTINRLCKLPIVIPNNHEYILVMENL